MHYLYSLHDALASIGVPDDKARAVIDAMERDLGSTIATKMELQLLRQDLQHLRQEMATKVDLADVRQECTLIRKDMESLSTTLTLRLGSMLMFGLGLLFAALKIT